MSKIIYSTDKNWQEKCENCDEPLNLCKCRSKQIQSTSSQTAFIRREKKGRAGKTAPIVSKLKGDLKPQQKEIQKKCATGGSVKNGTIEIQGDHRGSIASILKEKGCKVKFIGG